MWVCLESYYVIKDQQRLFVVVIVFYSVKFVINVNGVLFLIWFLDICIFLQRCIVFLFQFVFYLVNLCIYKVVYLMVFKVINQKVEGDVRDIVFKVFFFIFNDQVLEVILSDYVCGVILIFKVFIMFFFDEIICSQVVEMVKNVLICIKVQLGQGYKWLMDEVGLFICSGGGGGNSVFCDYSNDNR